MPKLLLLLLLLIWPLWGFAQTIQETSYVPALRAKVNEILALEKRISDAREERVNQDVLEQKRLNELRQELTDLIREKQQALEELRQGYYCSQCKRPRSQVEREENESYASHLQRVSGRSVPATQEMLDKTTGDYDRKIATQEQKINDFEKLENEFDRKRDSLARQITDDEERLRRLRMQAAEIVAQWARYWENEYLQIYRRVALESAQEQTTLNRMICQRNNLTIEHQAYKNRMEQEREQRVQEYKERMQAKVAENNSRIGELEKKALAQDEQRKNELLEVKRELDQLTSDLDKLETQFRQVATKTGSDTLNFGTSQRALKAGIARQEARYREREQYYARLREPLVAEAKRLREEIFQILAQQPAEERRIQDAVRQAVEAKEIILRDLLAAAEKNIDAYKQRITTQFAVKQMLFTEHNQRVATEAAKINSECARGSIYNRAGVETFQPWTVVNSIQSQLESVAASALRTQQPYSSQFANKLDTAVNLAQYSAGIINACQQNGVATDNSSQQTLNSKFDLLKKKL